MQASNVLPAKSACENDRHLLNTTTIRHVASDAEIMNVRSKSNSIDVNLWHMMPLR